MIAVDTNILVYAHREELPLHDLARESLTRLAQGADPWAIPVFCLGEFLRVISHPRVFDSPHTSDEATSALESLMGSPTLRVLSPGTRYLPLLADCMRESGATGNLVLDAQIAAVCREHGVRSILTEDRDFLRFSGPPICRLS